MTSAHATPRDAFDRIDFGNTVSEAEHKFEPNTSQGNMPIAGTGAYGFTYRQPVGNGTSSTSGTQLLIFTMASQFDDKCVSHKDSWVVRMVRMNDLAHDVVFE